MGLKLGSWNSLAFGDGGGGEEGWDEGVSGSSSAMDEVRVGGWRLVVVAGLG